MTIYSSRRATTPLVISRRLQVCESSSHMGICVLTLADDVRDIYRRAEQEELVVEGLREGDNLVGQE